MFLIGLQDRQFLFNKFALVKLCNYYVLYLANNLEISRCVCDVHVFHLKGDAVSGNSLFFSQGGEEKVKIERPGGSPVWTLSWNPSK